MSVPTIIELSREIDALKKQKYEMKLGLETLREQLKPQFDEWASRHDAKRPCVETLLDYLIKQGGEA